MPQYLNIAAAFITACILLWLAGFVAFSVHVKGLRDSGGAQTDAIIVLTGGPDRINAGLDLLADKQAKYLFISGVDTRVSVEQLISMWRPDIKRPPCCIILGHQAQNTLENAAEARDWIEMNEIKSARLLTADYHMPRAQLAFAKTVPNIDIRPYPVVSSDVHSHVSRYLYVTLREYNKTLLTWLQLRLTGTVA